MVSLKLYTSDIETIRTFLSPEQIHTGIKYYNILIYFVSG